MRAQQHFLTNDDRVGDLLTTALRNVFWGIIGALPTLDDSSDDTELTVPLVNLMRNPGDLLMAPLHYLQARTGRRRAIYDPATTPLREHLRRLWHIT